MPGKSKKAEIIKEGLIQTNVNTPDGNTYTTGVSAFASLFNGLVGNIDRKARKEMSKPKYRFLNNRINKENSKELLYQVERNIEGIEDQLRKYGYTVKIYEDLDCEDIDKENRYYIRIFKQNKIYSTIDLLEYENNIKDFSFDELEFIENIVCKMEGHSSERTKKIADDIVEYLSNIIYFRVFYYLTYAKIGWEYHISNNPTWIFKYDKIYSIIPYLKGEIKKGYDYGLNCSNNIIEDNKDKIFEYIINKYILPKEFDKTSDLYNKTIQEIQNILINLDDYKWVVTTKDLISNHVYDALILGAGISGLIRQLLPYTKETNININICGKPASGKSTISHYLLGIFGNPELLEGSFTDTDNSMEFNRVSRPVLPYVLDERMLKAETTSESAKRQKMFIDVFREYEGKVKERLGKQYEELSGERTYGPIISSSVDSMMNVLYTFENNVGQYRRFIELKIKREDLFSNSKEADNIEHIAYKCYGYGIRIIIDYMIYILAVGIDQSEEAIIESENTDFESSIKPKNITERFNNLNEYIKNKLQEKESEKVGDLTSSSKRFALIVLSYQILREALEFYIDNLGVEETRHISEEGISIGRLIENKNIPDLTDNIINELIDNLIQKMNHLEIIKNKSNEELLHYIEAHPNQFILVTKVGLNEIRELKESKGTKLGYYTRVDDGIELYTIYDYQLDIFWYMNQIPEPEIIKEYIEYVEDEIDKLKGEKKSPKFQENMLKYAERKYNAIPEKAQKLINSNNKTINGKPVKFSTKIIKIDVPQLNEEEQDEKTQSKRITNKDQNQTSKAKRG